jgi:hypothetical protein
VRPKYEREIEEILEKLDEPPPASSGRVLTPVRPLESPPRPPRRQPLPSVRLSPSGLMVAALVLAVATSPLQTIYPAAVALVGLVAGGLFIASLALSVTRIGRSRETPMWRGREMPTGGGFLANTPIARRWRRWRARRRLRDTRWS